MLETTRSQIVGDLTLPEDGYRSRLSDLLNRQDLAFVALTSAEVKINGSPPQKHSFLAVARDHIEFAYELGE